MKNSTYIHSINLQNKEELKRQIFKTLDFYYPACMDYEKGGYINGFLVDGSVNDTNTKHLVATGRYIYNFSIGVILGGKSWCLEAARHGIQFLNKHHLDKQHDGYFFEMNDLGVKNSAKMPMVMPLFCWILNSLQSRCGRGKRSVGQRLQCR